MTGRRPTKAGTAGHATALRTPGARAARLSVTALTDKEQLDCAVALAQAATGADDLRELLAAAGLDRAHLKALRDAAKTRGARRS